MTSFLSQNFLITHTHLPIPHPLPKVKNGEDCNSDETSLSDRDIEVLDLQTKLALSEKKNKELLNEMEKFRDGKDSIIQDLSVARYTLKKRNALELQNQLKQQQLEEEARLSSLQATKKLGLNSPTKTAKTINPVNLRYGDNTQKR